MHTALLQQITPAHLRELRKLARDKNVTPAQMVELLIEQAVKREGELNQGVKVE